MQLINRMYSSAHIKYIFLMSGYKVDPLPKNLYMEYGNFYMELLNEEKIGRIGTLKSQLPLVEFTRFVVKSLGCGGIRYVDAHRPVYKVAVGGGACASEIDAVLAAGCDTFVTSDLRYNDFLEDVVCPVIVSRLAQCCAGIEIVKSTSHKEVIQYYT